MDLIYQPPKMLADLAGIPLGKLLIHIRACLVHNLVFHCLAIRSLDEDNKFTNST